MRDANQAEELSQRLAAEDHRQVGEDLLTLSLIHI